MQYNEIKYVIKKFETLMFWSLFIYLVYGNNIIWQGHQNDIDLLDIQIFWDL